MLHQKDALGLPEEEVLRRARMVTEVMTGLNPMQKFRLLTSIWIVSGTEALKSDDVCPGCMSRMANIAISMAADAINPAVDAAEKRIDAKQAAEGGGKEEILTGPGALIEAIKRALGSGIGVVEVTLVDPTKPRG